MLIDFAVANFRSIRDRQELSMVALDKDESIALTEIPGAHLKALPAVGIFGPNASGKSNILHALNFMIQAVRLSHQRWLPGQKIKRSPFLLDSASRGGPTTFEADIVVDNIHYQYGFSCDDDTFLSEWLHSYPEGRVRRIFHRTGDDIKFGPHFSGPRKSIARLVRPNSLFLSAAAANNHAQLLPVYEWFGRDCRVAIEGNNSGRLEETLHLLDHEVSRRTILRLIEFADFGIRDVRISHHDVSPEEGRRIADALRILQVDESDIDPADILLRPEIELVHAVEDGEGVLPLEVESSGTQTWLEFVGPVFTTLVSGGVLVVDEIDARLHPLLTGHLVKLFQDSVTNSKGGQLLFNSHDVTLLGPNAPARLRRDQVWLTEKNRAGATVLYPLTEYRVRDGLDNVERSYLRGRYGGVPFIDESLVSTISEA